MIIATRQLTVVKDGIAHPVAVRIFAPQEEARCWGCRHQIDWPDGMRDFTAYGSDAVQALILTLELVGVHLYVSAYHAAGELQSLGADWIGYGFPVPATLRDRLIGEDAKAFGSEA